eukprot:gnl/Chilomastix_caulleri/289.p2 GENE.gnl/Chilomastix_caulleri/289~~gnl/Chilomastix_caulleri/289.p2  ORF type:complete len:133 (+),score=62.92 gnl/Chilomastix_caulleri/289:731-1129(+)
MQSSKKAPAATQLNEKPIKKDGVEYVISTQGKGVGAKAGDVVRISFVTKSVEGATEKVIEETPAGKYSILKLGSPETSKFMTSGVVGMKTGEKRELTIPIRTLKAEKSPTVPVDHPLHITVTLLEINPKPKK